MNKLFYAVAPIAALGLAGCNTMMDANADAGMGGASASASSSVMVGGAPMLPNRTIVANASQASNLTTLVSLVTAAGLGDTLSGAGPFTVFAPTNAAFQAVPQATLTSLQQPANRAQLQGVLTYHVVPGRITAADLMSRIRAGNGTATIATVQGEPLTFRMQGQSVVVTGRGGGTATVTQADVAQSNGMVHVVNGVLLP